MKHALLAVILLGFSVLPLVAINSPAQAQAKKIELQKALRDHIGQLNQETTSPNGSPTDSNFAKFMRLLKRQSK